MSEETKILFGLEAQGHIPTIKTMLAEGADWQDIGRRIQWDGETAKEYYERYLTRAASVEAADAIAAKDREIAELRAALEAIVEMANWQIGVPADTEAANEHARIAQSMSDTARAAIRSLGKEGSGEQ